MSTLAALLVIVLSIATLVVCAKTMLVLRRVPSAAADEATARAWNRISPQEHAAMDEAERQHQAQQDDVAPRSRPAHTSCDLQEMTRVRMAT